MGQHPSGPSCQITVDESGVTVVVSGGPDDSMEEVVQACHAEHKWASDGHVSADVTEVITLTQDDDGTWR